MDIEAKGVRWETILRRESVRVLLAEPDDSTREIIGALLRNCGYRVASVSDGLKAWETLKENQQDIDLVLMEVELPLLSGFELLTMITENEACKNIPVIMMSSYDYIGMVFKFMLKGAADFLIKPLRKNELRNLWQHVWRRYSLNGESGEANARQNIKTSRHKCEADSENDAASNHCGGYFACTEKSRDCSEKGSDAQSSCTRPVMDTEGADVENMLEFNKEQLKGIFKNSGHITAGVQGSDQNEFSTIHDVKAAVCSDMHDTNEIKGENSDQIRLCTMTPDLLGAMDTPMCSHTRPAEVKASDDRGVLIDISDPMSKLSSMPELELSLKIHEPCNYASLAINRQNILNHSNLSAFSRYSGKSMLSTPPASADLQEEKEDNFHKIQQSMEQYSQDECSHDQNHAFQSKDKTFNFNGEDTSSTLTTSSNQEEKAVHFKDPHITSYIAPTCGNSCTAFLPQIESVLSPQLGAPPWIFNTAFVKAMPILFSSQTGVEVDISEQSHHSHNQGAGKEICDVQNQIEITETANNPSILDQSESSNICNYHETYIDDMHGSVSDGSDESLTMKDVARSAIESLNYGGFPSMNGPDPSRIQRSIHREAALNKFRLKRKERCFEKKVRYQSRKKLAEQRPRIKGQFVRQVQPGPESTQQLQQ